MEIAVPIGVDVDGFLFSNFPFFRLIKNLYLERDKG